MKITKEDNMCKEKHIKYLMDASKNGWGLQSHGFIYKTTQGFYARSHSAAYLKDGVEIKENFDTADGKLYENVYFAKDSFIEFRFECNFHFRDKDNNYYMIDPSIVAIKCIPFAKIHEDVRFANKLNLSEILEQKLYTLVK